ncbi:hypothetical protein ABLE91_06450 [Aquabacter sp. CN5-332]|uniref:hypothetical protein n=1 Tax=Aquabacter sp. CN5-332 TaxID=3156608 RepID=UPI0032B5D8DE
MALFMNIFTKAVVIAAAFDWLLGGLFVNALRDHLTHESMLGFAAQWAVAAATIWQLVQLIGLITEHALGTES